MGSEPYIDSISADFYRLSFKTRLYSGITGLAIVAVLIVNALPCYNLGNIIITIAALLLFIFAELRKGVTYGLSKLRQSPAPSDYPDALYSNAPKNTENVSDEQSWYNEKDFCLVYNDRRFKESNLKLSYEEIRKWPFFFFISDCVWYILAAVWFIVNFKFYEWIIPNIENSAAPNDASFAFVDRLVFYLPSLMILVNALIFLAISVARKKKLRSLCVKIVDTNLKNGKIESSPEGISTESLWYHNECPNCCAYASDTETRCKNCGTSLRVLNINENLKIKCHKIVLTKNSDDKNS